jgi:bifunctional DNA primase/polymerase-like protein/primase-like protein
MAANSVQHSTLPEEVRTAAARGWRLLPVKPRAKTPLVKEWQKVATSNLDQLEGWAGQFPGCNWGVATGPDSGVWVLDVDGEKGRESLAALEAEHGPLPPTLSSRTGREDGGEHRWFAWQVDCNIRNRASTLAPGLDVRGAGGYVVIPPSMHPSRAVYQWAEPQQPIADAPGWLLELAACPVAEIARDAGRIIPEGQRNETLFRLGCAMRGRGETQEQIEAGLHRENAVRCVLPLVKAEIHRIAESICSRYPSGPSRPDARQPQRDYLLSARAKNNLDFLSRSKWKSPMFGFARLLKARVEFSGMDGLAAAERIEHEIENPWELFADVCADPRAQLIADWDKAHTPETLALAWSMAQESPLLPAKAYSERYCQFVKLAAALQQLVGSGKPIALPQREIASLLGCDRSMIGQYIRWAVADGLLQPKTAYVRCQKAAEFCYIGPQCHSPQESLRVTKESQEASGPPKILQDGNGVSGASWWESADGGGENGYVEFDL